MENNIISVIIVVVKRDKKYLKNCLISLEKSAYIANISLEIIIVANGTKLKKLSYLSSTYKILSNRQNLGFGNAVNKGMNQTNNKWCIILAPDTRIKLTTIQSLWRHTVDKKLAIICPKIHYSDGKLDYSILPYTNLWTIFKEQFYLYKLFPSIFTSPFSNNILYEKTHEVDALASTFWMVKKNYFINVGGFDERFFLFHDDLDLCRRIRSSRYKIIFEPKASITHLGHKSVSNQIGGKLLADSYYIYLSKYYNTLYIFICIIILFIGSLFRFTYWFLLAKIYSYGKYKSENKVVFHLSFLVQCLFLLKRIVYSYRPYPVSAHL